MAKTIVEKVLSRKSGRDAHAGDIVVARVDVALTNDASGPLMIDYFRKMEADSVAHPESVVAILDHYVPCPNSRVAGLHQSLYDFKEQFGIRLVDGGEGIAHQVFDELGYVKPGSLIVGGDSHTTTHGYLNCLGIGVGASDLACAVYAGELWFRVPETIKINLTGALGEGICGKDVALWLLGALGSDGGNYKAVEFGGDGISCLTIDDRKTICNLFAECCAKCAIMPFDKVAEEYCKARGISCSEAVSADEGCLYCREIQAGLSSIPHMVSVPHSVAGAVPLETLAGTKVDMAVIGTCTNGRVGDFTAIETLLKTVKEPFRAETLVIPASRRTYREIIRLGIADMLLSKGAMILPPSCGPCCGSSPGVPRDGFNVISTANRNFLGRMGNVKANIYLSSPLVVAASAIAGKMIDPKELM